jgi:hypothetical protein
MNPLLDVYLAKTFSHYVTCAFIVMTVSFAVQMLFSLMQSILKKTHKIEEKHISIKEKCVRLNLN